jgi:uncharacterized membrane protein
MSDEKQSTAIPPGIASFAAYFFPFVGGLIFLAIERENMLVRFHAAQSVIFWICCIPLAFLSTIPVIGVLFSLVFLVAWIFLLYQAWKERMYEIPYLGAIARKQVFPEEGETPSGDESGPDPGEE